MRRSLPLIEGSRITSANPYPALDLWWRELAVGKRLKTTCDALWLAAAEEYAAKEWYESGLPKIAESCRSTARRIVHDAARR